METHLKMRIDIPVDDLEAIIEDAGYLPTPDRLDFLIRSMNEELDCKSGSCLAEMAKDHILETAVAEVGRLIHDGVFDFYEVGDVSCGPKTGRFEVVRVEEGKYQVLVDETFGFFVEFDGVRFVRGVEGRIDGTDSWFFLNGGDCNDLIEAIKNAPDGERLNPPAQESNNEEEPATEEMFLEQLRSMDRREQNDDE